MLRTFLCCTLLTTLALVTGCEDDDHDAAATTETPAATPTATDEAVSTDPHFPDGLHPDSAGDQTIASVFARRIKAAEGGIVVCLGDSITRGGYPGPLAGALAGMTVVDEGKGGEKSSGGADRVKSVLSQYRPTHLCILYGANDIIGAHASAEAIAGNLESIIRTARLSGAIPVIATLTPLSGDYLEYADEARAASVAIRQLASRTGTALADIESAF